MEVLLVIALVGLAAVHVGYTFYKQLTGKGGCSSCCACNAENKKYCDSSHYNSLDGFILK